MYSNSYKKSIVDRILHLKEKLMDLKKIGFEILSVKMKRNHYLFNLFDIGVDDEPMSSAVASYLDHQRTQGTRMMRDRCKESE